MPRPHRSFEDSCIGSCQECVCRSVAVVADLVLPNSSGSSLFRGTHNGREEDHEVCSKTKESGMRGIEGVGGVEYLLAPDILGLDAGLYAR